MEFLSQIQSQSVRVRAPGKQPWRRPTRAAGRAPELEAGGRGRIRRKRAGLAAVTAKAAAAHRQLQSPASRVGLTCGSWALAPLGQRLRLDNERLVLVVGEGVGDAPTLVQFLHTRAQ